MFTKQRLFWSKIQIFRSLDFFHFFNHQQLAAAPGLVQRDPAPTTHQGTCAPSRAASYMLHLTYVEA